MWYGVAYRSQEEAQGVAETLREKGLIAEALPIALPFAPERTHHPTLTFPGELREQVIATLEVEDGPEISTANPQINLILTDPVTVLGQPGDRVEVIKQVLEVYSRELDGVHIVATNPHGGLCRPVEDQGVLHVRFYAAPREQPSETQQYPKAFGYGLPPGIRDGVSPSGGGTPIRSPEGVVAEVHGKNLFILFDLPHDNGDEEIVYNVLAQVLERYLAEEGSRLAARTSEPEARYVRACLQRHRFHLLGLKRRRSTLEGRISKAEQTINECTIELEETTRELRAYERPAPADTVEAAKQEYQDLLNLRHVERAEISGDYVVVHTDRIFLQYDGETYSMGSYRMKIPLSGQGAFKILNKTPKRSGSTVYHHPHIKGDEGSQRCLGNFAPINGLVDQQQWALVAQFMIEFLHSVNDRADYIKKLQDNWKPLKRRRPCSCQRQRKKGERS